MDNILEENKKMKTILHNLIVALYLLWSGDKRLDKEAIIYKRRAILLIIMTLLIIMMTIVCFLIKPTEFYSTPLA